MASSSPVSVLTQPGTEFARSMNGTMGNAPWASGMTSNSSPFGAGGLGNPMANALPGLNGTSSYNPSRGPTLGAFDQLHFHLCVDFNKFEHHRTGAKQITFVSRHATCIAHDMKGLSSMNQYLHSDAGMEKYGKERTAYEFTEDWSLYGVPVSNTAANLAHTSDKCYTFHLGKRARVTSPAAMMLRKDRANKPSVSVGDYVYLLIRRYQHVDPIASIFGASSTRAPRATRHYWRIDPYISHDKMPPSPELYNSFYGAGVSLFVGSVYTVYGDTSISAEAVANARDAFHPTMDNSDYIHQLKRSFDIDINLGVR